MTDQFSKLDIIPQKDEGAEKYKDPKYKKVEDLPEEAQSYFRPAPGGGFVLNSVRLLEDVKHALWSGASKSDQPLGSDLMVTEREFTERVKKALWEKIKSGTLSKRFKAFITLFLKDDYNYEPSKIGAELIENVLNEVTLEAATLTNEGLTKYANLNFERGKSIDLQFEHSGHKFPVETINPFSISGTLEVGGEKHRLKIIYATRGHQSNSYGNRRIDKGGPELFAVYYDDQRLSVQYDKSPARLLADKIFSAIVMRAENMPNENDKLFAESFAAPTLETVVAQINEDINNHAREKVAEESKKKPQPTKLDELEKFVGRNY